MFRNILSAAELGAFLILLPLWVIWQPHYGLRRGLLVAAGIYAALRLWHKISWRRLFAAPPSGWWKGPVFRASLALCLICLYVILFEPQKFLNLPKEHFWLWLGIIILYPLVSVLPQEIIYRVYIFEVHKKLLNPPLLALIVSSLTFAWVHIVFAGWFAVGASLIAGIMLGWNYHVNRTQNGAIWPLLLEHSLYGQLVFSLGLGQYFYFPR